MASESVRVETVALPDVDDEAPFVVRQDGEPFEPDAAWWARYLEEWMRETPQWAVEPTGVFPASTLPGSGPTRQRRARTVRRLGEPQRGPRRQRRVTRPSPHVPIRKP